MEKLNVVTGNPLGNYWNSGSFKAIIAAIFIYGIGIVMFVNNETGEILPIKEIVNGVRKRNPAAL